MPIHPANKGSQFSGPQYFTRLYDGEYGLLYPEHPDDSPESLGHADLASALSQTGRVGKMAYRYNSDTGEVSKARVYAVTVSRDHLARPGDRAASLYHEPTTVEDIDSRIRG